MNTVMYSLLATTTFFICAVLATQDRLALSRMIFASLLMTVIACLALPAPSGDINGWDTPIIAQGQYENGSVAETIVERSAESGLQRTTFIDRALILEKPLPTLTYGLWALLILTLMGLVFTGMAPQKTERARFLEFAALYGLISCLLILWWSSAMPASESGELGIRDYLRTFSEIDDVMSFTVPADGWSYVILGGFPTFAVYMTLIIVVVAFLRPRIGVIPLGVSSDQVTVLQVASVILALVCVFIQVSSTGGLPWRPDDGAVFLTSLILVSAHYYGEENAAALPMAAAAIFPVLIAYTL